MAIAKTNLFLSFSLFLAFNNFVTLAKLPDYALSLAKLNDDNHLEYALSKILIPRVVGSSGHRKVQDFLISELESYGLTVELDRFSERAPIFGNLTFTNIIGKYNPNADEFLAIACHYDSKYFPNNPNFVGAIDSAVPCAIMLNVAKIITPHLSKIKQKSNLGILYIFFDGEEAFKDWSNKDSVYGSRHLAKKMSEKVTATQGTNEIKSDIDRIEVLALLDLIGARNSKFRNFFPNTEALHSLLVNIERNLFDEKQLEGKNFQFLASYSDNFVDDDHRPFLRRDVPILHLISTPFPKQWHKPSDNAANLHWPSIRNFNKVFRLFTYIFVFVHDENVNFRFKNLNANW
ncbi:glutaminyl-peptide cyclotransferase-like [Condylostylus longicornis]|uniref:glutaminyl-peptide cyclotransferase-like n=1 Tax=Condylostylus longicornis TaxID=2530218 RepID=UPI00244DAFA1|nr:glutaminyl-peptide cyclotransferase-like [Condylostylus longicornis]